MGVLFESNPAAMAAILALFAGGFLAAVLGLTGKEIKAKWLSVLAPSTLWGRIGTFAFGAFSILTAVGLAVLITYRGPDTQVATGDPQAPSSPTHVEPTDTTESLTVTEPPEPTAPPLPEPSEAAVGTPDEVDFTIPVIDGHNPYCWDLDVAGTAQSERSWFGLCASTGNQLDVHQGYGLTRWDEEGEPDPRTCLDQITRHGAAGHAEVAVGSVVCVSTRENRVAVLTVDSLDGGFGMSGEVWGPLLD